MNFSGVITNDRSNVHAKGQGQWLKVKVTDVKTQFSRFRTVTPHVKKNMERLAVAVS